MTYERRFAKYLARQHERGKFAGQIFDHHWIHFEDTNGTGWAQPDIFVVEKNLVTVFELKLTQNSGAWEQLHDLYEPLLVALFKRPTKTVQVCKNLLVDDGTLVSRLEDITAGCTLHWTR